jgi:hypothetical protein
MNKELPHIITPLCINIVTKTGPKTILKDDPLFDKVKQAIKNRDWNLAETEADKLGAVKNFAATTKKVNTIEIKNNNLYYKGEVLYGYIVDQILNFIKEDLPIDTLLNFLEKLMNNPSKRCVDELYKFLEQKNMPIDPDGDFYAYKAINLNWTDIYTGKIDNSIGSIVEMPRNQVDDNSARGCSTGFHAGSIDYVKSYGRGDQSKYIIVKINPSDVVSVPNEDCRKLRTCKYVVVDEYKDLLPDTTYDYTIKYDYTYDEDYDDGLEDDFFEDDNDFYYGYDNEEDEEDISSLSREEIIQKLEELNAKYTRKTNTEKLRRQLEILLLEEEEYCEDCGCYESECTCEYNE